MSREGMNKILIRGTNWIGDAILTLPAVTSIRATYPQGHIAVLVKPWVADIYKLFAGLAIAVEHGLEMPDSLEKVEKLYVDYNIFKDQNKTKKKLESLPASCWESAECLIAQRQIFEKDGVFPSGVIDNVAAKLKAYDDKDLSEKLFNKNDEIRKLVKQYLHCS